MYKRQGHIISRGLTDGIIRYPTSAPNLPDINTFSVDWKPTLPFSNYYTVHAVARDLDGNQSSSNPVTFSLSTGQGLAPELNLLPIADNNILWINGPLGGGSGWHYIKAYDVQDFDGEIREVRFYANGELIGTCLLYTSPSPRD